MSKHPAAKRCPECKQSFSVEEVVCVECEEVFEEPTYLAWIGGTSVLAVALVWWMLGRFSLGESLKVEAALLLLLYPAAKLVQKLRDPRRPVLREMGSVFASRSDRVMILLLILCYPVAFTFSGALSYLLRTSGPSLEGTFNTAVLWFDTVGGAIACLAIVIDQKLPFFDLRIRNTYVERYR